MYYSLMRKLLKEASEEDPKILASLQSDLPEHQKKLKELSQHPSYGIRSLVAKNPTTSAETLDSIMNDKEEDYGVKGRAMMNPNISRETFINYLHDYPGAGLENPSLALWDLEDPTWVNNIPPGSVQKIMDRTKGDWLHRFVKHPDAEVRNRIANSGYASPEVLNSVDDQGQGGWWISAGLVNNPNTPFERLQQLTDRYPGLVAKHRNATTPFLKSMLGHMNIDAHQNALNQLASRQEPMDDLASHPFKSVREMVAKHPLTSPKTLTTLSKDKQDVVKFAVANHPNTPPVIKEKLAKKGYA